MRAHRTKVQVSENHELRLTLPSDFPAGEAEVIVFEPQPPELAASSQKKLTVDEFLAARLTPPAGSDSVSLSDIEAAIAKAASERGST